MNLHETRHGTISNFRSISISKFSETWFSKSISISKFFKKFIQYQNQYQYQNFSTLNIKINIKIFQSPKSISISMSKLSKYWYWYWKSKIFGPKSLLFNLLLLLCHLGHHQIPIELQHESLALGPMGSDQTETHGTPPIDPWDPTWNLCISPMN